jgi:hypothetical protein
MDPGQDVVSRVMPVESITIRQRPDRGCEVIPSAALSYVVSSSAPSPERREQIILKKVYGVSFPLVSRTPRLSRAVPPICFDNMYVVLLP